MTKKRAISSKSRRGGGCLLVGFFTIWNGIVVFALVNNIVHGEDFDEWLPLLVLSLFAAVGLFMWLKGYREMRGLSSAGSSVSTTRPNGSAEADRSLPPEPREPIELTPQDRPKKFLFMLCLSLALNAAMVVYVPSLDQGLLVIGWSAGAGSLVATVYFGLALLNPRPVLALPKYPLAVGEEVEAELELVGSTHRIEQIELVLEGEESATSRRGKRSRTYTNVFYGLRVHTEERPSQHRAASFRFQVPGDKVPSFEASNNSITWRIRVRGRVRFWPNVDDALVVNVQHAEDRDSA